MLRFANANLISDKARGQSANQQSILHLAYGCNYDVFELTIARCVVRKRN